MLLGCMLLLCFPFHTGNLHVSTGKMKVYGEAPQLLHMQGNGTWKQASWISSVEQLHVREWNSMFVLSHFCIPKYTGAIAAVHVMRNVYYGLTM